MVYVQTDLLESLLNLYWKKDEIIALGITGRAGAGKTIFSKILQQYFTNAGIEAIAYNGDWDFRLSSAERKKWIGEPRKKGDLAEYARRANQESWWDFDQMAYNFRQLSNGNPVHIVNGYDQKTGDKIVDKVIEPPKKEGIVVIEQPFIGYVLPELKGLVYLYIEPGEGFLRLFARDREKRGIYDSIQRFAETTSSEDLHLAKHYSSMTALGDKFVAIDNTDFKNPKPIADYGTIEITAKAPFAALLVPVQYLR